jgi:hypothetical protein
MITEPYKLFIAKKQPLPDILRCNLPVNYFLFSAPEGKKKLSKRPIVKSTFYNTSSHIAYDFYKSISNIL